MKHVAPLPTIIFSAAAALAASCKATPAAVQYDDSEVPAGSSESEAAPAASSAKALPTVRVNQVGYFPKRGKYATWVSSAQAPADWKLLDASGTELLAGKTIVAGADASSGDTVHRVDFSAYQQPGTGLKLEISGESSDPFDIADDIYAQLKLDALHFFYHHRAGVPIEMPYAKEQRWTRGPGTVGEVAVECLPELECGFDMDVHGGWYDAGDHGKYVVNAGISAWTLLDYYERVAAFGTTAGGYADGSVPIPEGGNGVSDLLDEARFEVEWMMRMQVAADAPKWQGLAFHKVHELQWSPVPHNPANATVPRFLHRPSTAATLNLAATAAAAARIWKTIDPAFSKRCLASAERAWKAALANPELFAPGEDHTGGGPYDDTNVGDEFYWAAVELFLTTKKNTYGGYMKKSPHHLQSSTTEQSPMTWQSVGALGVISLAVVPSAPKDLAKKAREALMASADVFVANVADEGYRTPQPMTGDGKYVWGSSSFVLNNVVVLGLAYDFSKRDEYLQAAIDGLDYILGRNAMAKSYVSGYGERPLEHPHHRFWAHQKDPSYPLPPPGVVSGGPNSGLQDPTAEKTLQGCAPQKCYLDDIESWSTNEIAINWNAPLMWAVGFLDEAAR